MADFLFESDDLLCQAFKSLVQQKHKIFISKKQINLFDELPKGVFLLEDKPIIKPKKDPFELNVGFSLKELDKIKKEQYDEEAFCLAKEALKRNLIFVTDNSKLRKFIGTFDFTKAMPSTEFELLFLENIASKKFANDYIENNTFMKTEENGYLYPRPIKIPGIAFIPEFEPHVIISDWFTNPKDWYYIKYLIDELLNQSFVAYNKGLFLSSFFDSVIGIELTLKYEYARTHKENEKLITQMLGKWHIYDFIKNNYLKQINLSEYKTALDNINNARSGTFHFNFKLLEKATLKINPRLGNVSVHVNENGEVIKEYKNMDGTKDDPKDHYSIPTENLTEWVHFAYYTYNTYYKITKKLYGEHNHAKFLKEGLDDYDKNKDNIFKNMYQND